MEKDLPKGIPHIFVSAVAQKNLSELKDMIWEAIHTDSLSIPS